MLFVAEVEGDLLVVPIIEFCKICVVFKNLKELTTGFMTGGCLGTAGGFLCGGKGGASSKCGCRFGE